MAARSWVPGLSAVVCTENGGPLPSDQFSHRQVITTAMRASFGQLKPLAFFFFGRFIGISYFFVMAGLGHPRLSFSKAWMLGTSRA
jgi:hypothetical protein